MLSRHVVSQLELRRRSRQLADIRQEKEKWKNQVEKLRAQLADARREFSSYKRKKTGTSGVAKPKKRSRH
jgi:septation ring formation regulator EzrA